MLAYSVLSEGFVVSIGSGIELGCLVVEPLITGVDIEKGC